MSTKLWPKISNLLRSLFLHRNTYIVLLTPLIWLPLPLYYNMTETRCAYILLIMAVYWITEAVPLCVTAVIPIFGIPLAGVLPSGAICSFYINETSIVFVGGLIVAVAIEHCNLHRRIAMLIIIHVGQSPRLLMAGFMITTMILSMWISNTAATTIMVTVVEGILDIVYEDNETNAGAAENVDSNGEITSNQVSSKDKIEEANLSIGNQCTVEDLSNAEIKVNKELIRKSKYGYYLAIMYAANIGGSSVITGTPSNLILISVLSESFSEPTGVNFTSWMMLNIPGSIICTFIGWLWLQYRYIGFGKKSKAIINTEKEKYVKNFVLEEYAKLGPMTYHEKSVGFLFLILIPLWIFRDPGFLYGWGKLIEDLYGENAVVGDSVPVILISFLFFVLPAKNPFASKKKDEQNSATRSERIITWNVVQDKVAWGLIILLGGGVAMAKASDASGLSQWMGQELRKLDGLSPPVFLILVTTITSIVTELISNSAATSVVLPVLRELSLGLCTNPLYFMVPAAVSASFAFMLPVATPANAVVYFASGIPSTEMMKTGFVMNLLCVAIVNGVANSLGGPVFDFNNMPTWANSSISGTIPNC